MLHGHHALARTVRGSDQNAWVSLGKQRWVDSRERRRFLEVVALAFDPVPTGPNWVFTVTYRKAAGKRPDGTLIEGQTVEIKDGTIFNVTATDKS
jgi:hypothetical protein